MKLRSLTVVVAGVGIVAVAFAVHFELSARARVYGEMRGLRTEATTDLDRHRISSSQAIALESRLGRVSRQLQENDVRGAQKLLHRVKADLESDTRST
jgi:hypothetical protein